VREKDLRAREAPGGEGKEEESICHQKIIFINKKEELLFKGL